MPQPRLTIVAGLPGSGKTTLARELEARHGAFRLCPDEWMQRLGLDPWDDAARAAVEELQREVALAVLRAGGAAVVEWGTWTRAERDSLREMARQAGAAVELRFLDPPIHEIWRRLSERGYGAPVTRGQLEAWSALLERPTADELSLFDSWSSRRGAPA